MKFTEFNEVVRDQKLQIYTIWDWCPWKVLKEAVDGEVYENEADDEYAV